MVARTRLNVVILTLPVWFSLQIQNKIQIFQKLITRMLAETRKVMYLQRFGILTRFPVLYLIIY